VRKIKNKFHPLGLGKEAVNKSKNKNKTKIKIKIKTKSNLNLNSNLNSSVFSKAIIKKIAVLSFGKDLG
jgi:hypothetical protein